MWKSIASNALTFFVVILFLLGGVILWGQSEYAAEGPLDTAICLKVERGSNMRAVSRKLEEDKAISSGTIFRLGAEYTEKTGQLKAGSFLVPERASMSEITDIITRGGASTCGTEVVYRIGVREARAEVRELDPATGSYLEKAEFSLLGGEDGAEVVVPADYTRVSAQADTRYRVAMAEGVTSWQVVEALKAVDTLSGEVSLMPAEGTLAPDSYEFAKGGSRQELIDRMQQAQVAILTQAWAERDPDLPLESPEEVLILASIIEKETGVPEERRQVASVFINRLRQGMRLQTDPTVIYGITKGEGVLGRGLRQSELRAETPWNTYVIPALPPTPIANPGRASIMAAVHPDETPYVFFVADGTGGHAFAETLDEHNANVAKWREIEAQRSAN